MIITEEIRSYKEEPIDLLDGAAQFSAYKTIRRIGLFKLAKYPSTDSQGNYKYWFDIISPRRNSEVKNIDFDTKDILLFSDQEKDVGRVILADAYLKEYLKETDQASKLNEAVEKGSDWGTVVWKKVKDGYVIINMPDLMVLNQSAESIHDSVVIEHDTMTPVDMSKKTGVWQNVDKMIDLAQEKDKGVTEFHVYERNGEISEKEYFEIKTEIDGNSRPEGDPSKYLLAKIIAGGHEKDKPTTFLFAGEISELPYKEYHRTPYSGRWLRVGMYELLFDVQTRANEIGNQIARGLDWASKTVFSSSDRVIAQNILTDLQSGDIIKSADLKQVQTRMEGLDQLIADWNRIMKLADELSNSFEVITGESLPAGTPFSLGALLNLNASKLFDFIREKLGIALENVIQDWILPDMLKDLKAKDVIRLTGDNTQLQKYYQLVVDSWYVDNLLNFPPHSPEIGEVIKEQKIMQLMENEEVRVQLEKEMWENFKPRVRVIITAESYNIAADLETYKTFIQLEADPVRRTALIEKAMALKNIDASVLPKTPPEVAAGGADGRAPQLGERGPTAFERALPEGDRTPV